MKIKRSDFGAPRRRTSPLTLLLLILGVALFLLLGFGWVRGGEQPLKRIDKPIPASALGH